MKNCQFCSVVSKANGEDPIGTAEPFDSLLVMEIHQPWTEERLLADPILKQIHDLFHALYEQQMTVAVMAIAPDREYSKPGYSRVMYYRRPAKQFAEFSKQEFLIPEHQLAQLALTLFQQPGQLSQFSDYQQPFSSTRDLMVCTHGNVDIACARFGYPIYQSLRRQFASKCLRVWRCSHFGGHQFAPTLIDLPTGQVCGHLETNMLNLLVNRTGNLEALRPFYRGWAGLTRFEQIVEREIWMRQGWNWQSYKKNGQRLMKDLANEAEQAEWAEVRLEYTAPDHQTKGAYEARVETCGSVITVQNSGDAPIVAKQYRVSQIKQIALEPCSF